MVMKENQHNESSHMPVRWNIFARVLEDIMADHGCLLGQLVSKAGIHTQKVARLRRSLKYPCFHLLSPAELDHVISVFEFDAEEQLRIRTAVLATAIEEMLMDRINHKDALLATEQFYPQLLKILRNYQGRTMGAGVIKGEISMPIPSDEDDIEIGNITIEQALNIYDHGLLELHQSKDADGTIKGSADWLIWSDEIQKALTLANTRLMSFSN
jgi:hypothetical protein